MAALAKQDVLVSWSFFSHDGGGVVASELACPHRRVAASMGKRELKLLDPTQHSDVKLRRMGAIVRERLRLEAEAR